MPDGTIPDAIMQCVFCGEQEHVEVFEVWGHDFMLHTCCEGFIWTVKLGPRPPAISRHRQWSAIGGKLRVWFRAEN